MLKKKKKKKKLKHKDINPNLSQEEIIFNTRNYNT